jgi:PIN domain nuclease of toxin-antitoxin system
MATRWLHEVSLPRYVVDAHALYWYLKSDSRLSPAADAVFRLAESGNAVIVVPAIVVAEIYYLTAKQGMPLAPSRLMADLASAQDFALSDLGPAQLAALERLTDVPEMHDRLIAGESLVWRAPVITRDASIRAAHGIQSIW